MWSGRKDGRKSRGGTRGFGHGVFWRGFVWDFFWWGTGRGFLRPRNTALPNREGGAGIGLERKIGGRRSRAASFWGLWVVVLFWKYCYRG